MKEDLLNGTLSWSQPWKTQNNNEYKIWRNTNKPDIWANMINIYKNKLWKVSIDYLKQYYLKKPRFQIE